MNIIDYIPIGRDNAISRKQLCTITGLPDRLMRREIERARKDYAILNIDGSGYFRPAEGEAYLTQRWPKQERSRERHVRDANRVVEGELLGYNHELIPVHSYVRRRRRGEDEKPQVEGQMKL